MAKVIRIDGNVQWRYLQAKGGNWVAVCDPLNITLQSETWADLMEDIALSLDALLKDLLETKELEKFLSEHGWKAAAPIPSRPKNIRFDLPFFMAMADNVYQ